MWNGEFTTPLLPRMDACLLPSFLALCQLKHTSSCSFWMCNPSKGTQILQSVSVSHIFGVYNSVACGPTLSPFDNLHVVAACPVFNYKPMSRQAVIFLFNHIHQIRHLVPSGVRRQHKPPHSGCPVSLRDVSCAVAGCFRLSAGTPQHLPTGTSNASLVFFRAISPVIMGRSGCSSVVDAVTCLPLHPPRWLVYAANSNDTSISQHFSGVDNNIAHSPAFSRLTTSFHEQSWAWRSGVHLVHINYIHYLVLSGVCRQHKPSHYRLSVFHSLSTQWRCSYPDPVTV